jgi:hypothetical protein
VQGQAPSLPEPHATHWFILQVLPAPQSLFVEHSTGEPPSSLGGTHVSPLQTVPFGQSVLLLQLATQPLVVQVVPLAQSLSLVQGTLEGGETEEQP